MLDTGGGKAPQGMYHVRVAEVPKKELTDSGHVGYKFKFDLRSVTDPSLTTTHSERFMVWLMGPLADALGFLETPPGSGKYPDFELDKCFGGEFYAEIIHEKQTKGKNAGKIFARLINPTADRPMSAPPPVTAGSGKDEEEVPF